MTQTEKLGARVANLIKCMDELVKDYDLLNDMVHEYEWALEDADKECESYKAVIEALQQENLELHTRLSLRSN